MKSTFSLVVLLAPMLASAANWKEPPLKTLGVKLGIQTPSLGIEFKDNKDEAITPVKYQPMANSRTTLSLTYGPFGLSGGVRNPVSADDTARYGTSRVDDWQLRFYGRYGVWEIFYQDYEGYFLENTEQVDSTKNNLDPRILRPDLRSSHVGLQYVRSLSPEDYNMGAAFDHSIYQTKSGGSWLLIGALSRHRIGGDTPLIPTQVTASYPDLNGFKTGEFLTIRAGGGYGYNLVWDTFYLGGVLTLSVGSQQQKYSLTNGDETKFQSVGGGTGKLGLGSNGPTFFWGLQGTFDMTSIQIGHAQLNENTAEGTLFWGFRWDGVSIPPLNALNDLLFH